MKYLQHPFGCGLFLASALLAILYVLAAVHALAAPPIDKRTVRLPDMVMVSKENNVEWAHWWDRNSDTCYVVGFMGASSSSAVMAWAPHTACEVTP